MPDAWTQGAQQPDAGTQGARNPDARTRDQQMPDAWTQGAQQPDAGTRDARNPDARTHDAQKPDVRIPAAQTRHAQVLSGRVAVITGGSRGIGLGIAKAYRQAGAHVVIASRKPDGLAAAREELLRIDGDGEVHEVTANVGAPEDAERCAQETVSRLGRLDVLVNNAATNPYMGDLLDLDLPRAEKTVRVNQYGMVAWTRSAWRAWMAEHGGAVVNIASVGGLVVDPHIGWYNATKAAMLHMTRQLAYELGPVARVNAIAPGLIKTELARAVWEPREPILTARLPLRRLGTVEDVAQAALFLASEASSWMTGQTLVLDGGATVLPIGVEA